MAMTRTLQFLALGLMGLGPLILAGCPARARGASLLQSDPDRRIPFNVGTNLNTWQWYAAPDTNELRVFLSDGTLLPQYDEPNGSAHASLLQAWTIQPNAAGQTVAVIDAGQHGALVASVIGAPHDGVGIEGVAPGVEVLTYTVPSYSAVAVSEVISNLPPRVTVANLSFGYTGSKPPTNVLAAMRYRSNIVFTLAALNGNGPQDNSRDWLCNARLPNAVCVTASTHGDQIFGAYGVTNVTLAAAGRRVPADDHSFPFANQFVDANKLVDDILGEPRAVWSVTGTSFAAPLVAGAVALLRAAHPQESPEFIINRLCEGSDRSEYWNTRTRCGTLNIARSLTYANTRSLSINRSGLIIAGPVNSEITVFTSTHATGPWTPSFSHVASGWPDFVPMEFNEAQRFWKL